MNHYKKSDKLDFINQAHGHTPSMTSSNTSFLNYYLLLSVDCKFHEELDHSPFINCVTKSYCTLPGSKKAFIKHFMKNYMHKWVNELSSSFYCLLHIQFPWLKSQSTSLLIPLFLNSIRYKINEIQMSSGNYCTLRSR